jgi:hypothetical protein
MRRIALALLGILVGCAAPSRHTGTTRDPVAVVAPGFDASFDACLDVARSLHFVVERQDRRGGVITTEPMTGAQWFEPWRRELRTNFDVAESSLSTVRRILRFEIEREGESFRITPTATVQRLVLLESRISNAALYRIVHRPGDPRNTPEADRGVALPSTYWYDVGRDEQLEMALARGIEERLNRPVRAATQ